MSFSVKAFAIAVVCQILVIVTVLFVGLPNSGFIELVVVVLYALYLYPLMFLGFVFSGSDIYNSTNAFSIIALTALVMIYALVISFVYSAIRKIFNRP